MESPISMIDELRQKMQTFGFSGTESNSIALPSLLMGARASQATDPRDKVYGILSMDDPESRRSLDPDYSKSWETVMMEATIEVLLGYGQHQMFYKLLPWTVIQ